MQYVQIPHKDWQNLNAKINYLVNYIEKQSAIHRPKKWLSKAEAMELLGIKQTSLQLLRNEAKIIFRAKNKKEYEYDSASLIDYKNKKIEIPPKNKQHAN